MATRDKVLEALAGVEDPLLGKPILELDMLRALDIQRGRVRLTIALAAANHPMVGAIDRAVTSAVSRLDGVKSVDVGFTAFSEDEQRKLRERLQGPREGSPLMDPSTRTRIVAVSSGKGGVGKSSVSVNVAVQLARAGKRTAILDADVWGFSIPLMLGVDRPPMVIDKMMVPPQGHGVSLISMGFFVKEDQPVIWRGPMLHKALEQFLTDVYWGEPDFLVVDMPPGTGDVSLSVAQFLPRAEVVVVTTPQPAAQLVAKRAAQMARRVNLTVIGVVENMSWFRGDDQKRYEIFGSGGGAALASELDVPLLGQVPLEPELREGGDRGLPISVSDPASEAALAFEQITKRIEESGPKRRRRPELRVTPG